MIGSPGWHAARARAARVLAGAWFSASTLVAAGFGPRLTNDALTWSLLAVPGLAFVTVTLVRPRPRVPASLLWSGPWSAGLNSVTRLLRPYAPGMLAAAATIAAAYLGAGWSLLRGAGQGLGPLLIGPDPYVDWTLLVGGGAISALSGFLIILVVVLPLGAALDARRAWGSDRPGARRLLAFAVASLGGVVTIASLVMVNPGPAGDDAQPTRSRLENMAWAARAFASLLLGAFHSPASTPATWLARAGLALLLASLALYWWPTRRRAT
ncbi:hypothetical protein ACFQU3_19545 [Terrabacter sp. GCM10028922]|uniref:hypothetical protein n=1 Tax=Terrabacter sp. GCM10028922 TaxID=3273428 RepID=UPI00360B0991